MILQKKAGSQYSAPSNALYAITALGDLIRFPATTTTCGLVTEILCGALNLKHGVSIHIDAQPAEQPIAIAFMPYIFGYYSNTPPPGIHFSILEIAPAPPLSQLIRENIKRHHLNAELITADYSAAKAMVQIDIQHMPVFKDNSFDFFICSHVLEHVPDDKMALQELYRVLKPGGTGILMVPINLAAQYIDEDPGVVNVAERWKRFGQHDHVREYSRSGFIERVNEAGFVVHEFGSQSFGRIVFFRYGLHSHSVLYVVQKYSSDATSCVPIPIAPLRTHYAQPAARATRASG